ncbi:MAG: hypothetical protein IPL61_40010 [Myxococcales bacterium]|nr:hypothetical protein [Myxococcales bacterium]
MRRLVVVAALAGGCAHSYTALSYDLRARPSGPVQTGMPTAGQATGSLAFGFGTRSAGVEIVAHGHDLSLADDPWLAADVGMELRLVPVRRGPVAAFVHGGPMRALLYDSAAGELSSGVGLAYGLGLLVGGAGVHLFIDVHWADLLYAGTEMGVTAGDASLRSVALGLQFGG